MPSQVSFTEKKGGPNPKKIVKSSCQNFAKHRGVRRFSLFSYDFGELGFSTLYPHQAMPPEKADRCRKIRAQLDLKSRLQRAFSVAEILVRRTYLFFLFQA
jgi:hypothetical protein